VHRTFSGKAPGIDVRWHIQALTGGELLSLLSVLFFPNRWPVLHRSLERDGLDLIGRTAWPPIDPRNENLWFLFQSGLL